MMKFLKVATIALLGFAFAPNQLEAQMNIDTERSVIKWVGKKVTGEHSGTINVKEGYLTFEGEELIGGKVVVDMNSIVCSDLDAESGAKLVGHLKSDDFFGVDKHPTATFVITNVASRGETGDYKVTGELQIKGIKKTQKVNARVGAGKGAKVNITIDRSDFNIRYGSGSFFDNLGDKTIYDEFDLMMTLRLQG
ncbi:MAG: YceI family protein [Bacteroidota bacterium]